MQRQYLLRATLVSFLGIFCAVSSLPAQSLKKIADDDVTKFTTAGNISATITNMGTIGNRFTPPAGVTSQASCQYPKGSGIEHLSQAALWFGAISQRDGAPHVTTGATDVNNPNIPYNANTGYEFTSADGAGIKVRSSLPFDPNFDQTLSAISHQDFVMDFGDVNRSRGSLSDTIPDHTPLGVNIHLETYVWNFPFADNFILLNYTIKNVGTDTLLDAYVGMWGNAIVQNINLSGKSISSHMAKSYIDSLRMMYTFDYNGAFLSGFATRAPVNSYVGIKLLGTNPFPLKDSANGLYYSKKTIDSLGDLHHNTYYNAWQYNSQNNPYGEYRGPQLDNDKYLRMRASLPQSKIDALNRALSDPSPLDGTTNQAPNSYIDLLSVGPFQSLKPGDSVQVVFGIICAKKFGTAADDIKTDYIPVNGAKMRKNLASGAGWAQKAFDGEDVNGNNILDPNEDANGDGKLTRFTLPQPPRQPRVRATIENQRVTLYWDKFQSEQIPDPISHKLDFEGYRIYRSNVGADIGGQDGFLLSLNLIADYDRADDNIGYNTGFGRIKMSSPLTFPDDTTQYWYRYPPADDSISNLNGWQYLYGISAYDQGDSAIGVASLESAKVLARVIPGTLATSASNAEVGVYPNPYYANAAWDQAGERSRKIYFTNLPARATIKIFTMTGDLVAEIAHDAATYDGSGIKWFDDFSALGVRAQFAGGEHAWDLITKYDQAIATGLYLFIVKDEATGNIKRGKFVIIK